MILVIVQCYIYYMIFVLMLINSHKKMINNLLVIYFATKMKMCLKTSGNSNLLSVIKKKRGTI